jgi:outer membrane protein assembly factor BamE (lipoprotein component of BamABCDE complex)
LIHQGQPSPRQPGDAGNSSLLRRCLLFLFLAGCMALCCWCVGYFVAASNIRPGIGDVQHAHDQIEMGMTKGEVRSLLGHPHREEADEWDYYQTIFVSSILRINFGPDGRVVEKQWWVN